MSIFYLQVWQCHKFHSIAVHDAPLEDVFGDNMHMECTFMTLLEIMLGKFNIKTVSKKDE